MSTVPVHFTGTVNATTLATPTPQSPLAVYAVTFTAGAHTHWHTHPKGQGLYVTDGVALVHIEGQTAKHLTKGNPSGSTPAGGTGMALHLGSR